MSEIYKSTVKIGCSSDRGTAFFISENKLLTARHNIVSNIINGDEIVIQDGINLIKCSLEYEIEGIDIAIIVSDGYRTPKYLKLVNMPIEKGNKFHFFGYSNTLIGESTGISVDIRIQDYFTDSQSDFDTTAIVIDSFQPNIFKGFSGSPVYAAEDAVLGVIVKKLDGCIGFVSIKLISEKLREFGFEILENASDYIENSYSKRANKEQLKKAIKIAGQRFERELHQPYPSLEFEIEKLWNLEKFDEVINKIKETDIIIKEFILRKDIKIEEKIDLKKDVLENSKSLYSFYKTITKWNQLVNSTGKKIEFTKDDEKKMNTFQETLKWIRTNAYSLTNALIIKGVAGSGKTHLMCNIAETLILKTNVYLCFGTQFNKVEDPITQIQRILDFEDKEYLKTLNQQAIRENKRYVFIIDALNEGAGDNYWKTNISHLQVSFSTCENLVLITTVRTPFEQRIYSNQNNFFQLEGFENTENAVKAYFEHYIIDIQEANLNHYEFKNGLFLKIFCETYSSLTNYQRKELNTYAKLFRVYIQRKELDIADRIDEDEKKQLGLTFLNAIARYSANNISCQDIERQQARKISDRLCPHRIWSKSLLNAVLQENLLLENINWDYNADRYIDTLSFAYERLGDFLKASSTIESKIQIDILSDRLKKLIKEGGNDSKIFNYIVALNVVWNEVHNSELIEVLDLVNNKDFIDCFIESIPLRNKLKKSSFLEKLINDYLQKIYGARYIFNFFSYKQNDKEIVMYIHHILFKMDMVERDKVWTTAINEMYVNGELYQHYSTEIAKDIIYNKTDDDCFHYVVFMSWLLASSHPIVRDRVTRILFYILRSKPNLIKKLLDAFEGINDLYVLERLYCAIYGVVLVIENKIVINEIALDVYNRIYKDKMPLCNILLREWTLKILDKAKSIGVSADLFEKSLPPFDNYIEMPKDLDYKSLLGSSSGSKDIYDSVFGFSDFARYEIGTNSNNLSNQFTKNKLSEKLSGKPTFFSLDEIQKMILLEIHNMGWNDDLGKHDSRGNSYNRFKNDTERIGKKYQWLALYNVVARILDNYKLNHRWQDNKIHDVNYPWLTSYHSYFDPTLPIKELESDLDLDLFEEFIKPKISTEDKLEWLNSKDKLPPLSHFDQTDRNNEKWILLSTMDTFKTEEGDITKEYFIRYDSVFIEDEKVEIFEEWAKNQNFYGRWMPEWHDNIDYMLLEYNWSTQYKVINMEIIDSPENGCPCDVILTTEAQLQENSNSTDESYSGTTLLPNHELMTDLNLNLKRKRGNVYNNNSDLVAFYNRDSAKGKEGLYIKQSVLDQYLSEKKYTLVYYLIGEKSYSIGKGYNPNYHGRDLTGAYKYKAGVRTAISELSMVLPENSD